MAYVTVDDLVRRFGEVEIIRLSTPADQDVDGIVLPVIEQAAEGASAVMDSYIRKRYRTPLDVPPPEVVQKCCDIVRFELATGDGKTCSDEIRARQKDAMGWLLEIARGNVLLDLEEVSIGDESYAQATTRRAVFE
jgi:phage gp36-like protein